MTTICQPCRGMGEDPRPCARCDGQGALVDCVQCHGDGIHGECQFCDGDGTVTDDDTGKGEVCAECDGDGAAECDDCGGSGNCPAMGSAELIADLLERDRADLCPLCRNVPRVCPCCMGAAVVLATGGPLLRVVGRYDHARAEALHQWHAVRLVAAERAARGVRRAAAPARVS